MSYGPPPPPQPAYDQSAYPQQQYPQQYDYGQQPVAQPPPPKKSKKGLMVGIVAVVVVLIVVLAVVFLVFMKSPLVGKWKVDKVETNGVSAAGNGTIEFKGDGTGVMVSGSNSTSVTWKDVGGGKVQLTVSVSGISVTIEYTYTISGNTLTLEYSMSGVSSKLTCSRM